MRKVNKDLVDIPEILKSDSRKIGFESNVLAKDFVDTKTLYKNKNIQNKLIEIYNNKCAYCEKSLKDIDKHIEHYRPKKKYYWLAYSWDNLLLSCSHCNRAKGDRFQTKNVQINYNDELFEDIHILGDSYDGIELPLIINPEKDDILEKIIYDESGFISSKDERVIHTINVACKLNRNELVEKRQNIITDFKNNIEECFNLFDKKIDTEKQRENLKILIPFIISFLKNSTTENEFYSLKNFMLENVSMLFSEEKKQRIVKSLIQGLTK